MEIKKLHLIKDTIVALANDSITNEYYFFVAKIGQITIKTDEQCETCYNAKGIKIFDYPSHIESFIQIPLIPNENVLVHYFHLNNADEYKTIISILEVLL